MSDKKIEEQEKKVPASETELAAGLEDKQIVAQIHSQPHFKITIHSGYGPTEAEPVFLGANGYYYLIPRDKQVIVPKTVIGVLETAMICRARQVDGRTVLEKVNRFSYTVHSPAERPKDNSGVRI